MRIAVLLILTAATLAACRLGAGRAPRVDAPGSQQMLTALEGRLAALIDAGDTASLGALLAPEFALVGQDTTRRVARAVWIANTARLSFDSVRATVREVVVRGDSAQVGLELRFHVVGPGVAPAAEVYELADTWVRRDTVWQLTRRRLLVRRTTPR